MDKDREQEALKIDKEDLLAVLHMRFGDVPAEVREDIENIDKLNIVERLIVVAANVPTWETFLKELKEGRDAFRIAGQMYDPLANEQKGE